MKTIHMRHLLPIAAVALTVAGCDPFPAKPGGDPRIVRVAATDQNWTYHSSVVENSGTPGTVVVPDAFPLDKIYIQFNKPMNGMTLQKYADTDPAIPIDPATVGIQSLPADLGASPPRPAPVPDNGRPFSSCTVPTNLTLGGFEEVPGVPGVYDPATHDFQPGTGTYPVHTSVCYMPSSPSDGGYIVITPAVPLKVGTTYTVKGTVKDYQDKALAIDVTVMVDPMPYSTTVDGLHFPGYGVTYTYGLILDWFPTGATDYVVQSSLDGGSTWTDHPVTAASACKPAQDFLGGPPPGYDVCEVTFGSLPANTTVDFQVGDGTAPTTWHRVASPAATRGPLASTPANYSAPSAPTVVVEGAIALTWGRVIGALDAAKPWIVERAPDVSGAPDTTAITDITGALIDQNTGAARAVTSTARRGTDVAATPAGTRFWYRVTANFTAGPQVGKWVAKTSYKIPPP